MQRYLTDEPVEAFAARAAYRLRKLGQTPSRRDANGCAAAGAGRGGGAGHGPNAVGGADGGQGASPGAGGRAEAKGGRGRESGDYHRPARPGGVSTRPRPRRSNRPWPPRPPRRTPSWTAGLALAFLQDKVLAAGRPKAWAGTYDKAVKLRQALDAAEPQVAKAFVGRPLAVALTRRAAGLRLPGPGRRGPGGQAVSALTLRQTVQGAGPPGHGGLP